MVLITGASGLIGAAAASALADKYQVRVLNRRHLDGYDIIQADIRDSHAVNPAFERVDTVVHLAAALPWADGGDQELLSINVVGTYNVFEAARLAGVKRVVFASTGAISGGYMEEAHVKLVMEKGFERLPHPRPMITERDPARPTGLYAVTKIWGEALGRYYVEAHGMSVICIRFGRVTADDRPEDPQRASIYMSTRDAVQAIARSVDAPADLRYVVFYVCSDNSNRWRDIEDARKAVGFVPEDGIRTWPPAPQSP